MIMRKKIHFFFLDWSKRPAERDQVEAQNNPENREQHDSFVHHYLRLANFLFKRRLEERRVAGRSLSEYAS